VTAGLLLDSCAVIWVVEDRPLAPEARSAIETALAGDGALYVSPMTAWEIGFLAAAGRLTISSPPARWLNSFASSPGVCLAPLDLQILVDSCFLPGAPPGDPVDRIMAATARELGCRLVTRDRALLAYGAAGNLLTIRC
jgi:PIN domain nuclease of toxin-antitoxin system